MAENRPSRRAVAKGAAWTLPVVAVGAAAPSMAATGCPTTTTTGWGAPVTTGFWYGAATGGFGFVSGYTPKDTANCAIDCGVVEGFDSTTKVFLAERDADAAGNTISTTSTSFALSQGQVLQLAFSYAALGCNPNGMKFQLLITNGTTETELWTFSALRNTSNVGKTSVTTTPWPVPTSGTYALIMRATQLDAGPCSNQANDIGVTLPTFVSCLQG